jgi:threonine dehydrogenase-like Zn-dependent dehydrogenase
MSANGTMTGVYLPGNSTVEFREVPVPEPGYGQVLLRMKASSICGSDIRAIYHEHIGKGPEGYQGVIAGHEPCGVVEKVGPGCQKAKPGDRAIVYHITGCGICDDCRHGYFISCTGAKRAGYGWQRDGGHAAWLLAEEDVLVRLPDNLSYEDGALVACGFGTVWEALTRMGVSGADRLLITGLGPVGLAAAMLGKALGVKDVIGFDIVTERVALARDLGLVEHAFLNDDGALDRVLGLTDGKGCEVSIDCSADPDARLLALKGTRQWGRCALVGEGGTMTFDVSPLLIHPQITLYGSWVTSLKHMEDLVERLSRWDLHPDRIVTHRFPLSEAAEAYRLAESRRCGKVCIVFD